MDAEYKTNQQSEPLLSVKEVAVAIGHHVSYVYRLRKLGLSMPGGRITLSEVKAFLVKNPVPWKGRSKILNSTKKR